jgi:peroxiredoxin Q/BCP|tara:strand:+ start:2907 stop:3404 length:498 start_codon:yes stop_codon:yes gene_type:complete
MTVSEISSASHPVIGAPAPDFSLRNQSGDVVSLDSFLGKKTVVLYFYPKASTPGCTTQACGIRDSGAELAALDVAVLGVSPDPEAKLQRFIDKQSLNFDLLSDEELTITKAYGCWALKKFMGKEFMGVVRTTFIIGKDGTLLHIMDKFKTKTHHDDLLAWLQGNQ